MQSDPMIAWPARARNLAAGLLLGLLASPAAVLARDFQPLQDIRQAVQAFVESQPPPAGGTLQVTVGRLDPRLRLPHCREPLQAFLPPGGRLRGGTTVGVRCPESGADAKPWTVYVPARIGVRGRVLVTRHPLPRGSRITASDLEYREFDLTTLRRGYFTDQERLVGKILRQALPAGKVVSPEILDRPKLVRRGQEVTILATSGGFEVRMKGQAMMDGASGEIIKVRNLSSRRIVEGEIIAAGTIKVPL